LTSSKRQHTNNLGTLPKAECPIKIPPFCKQNGRRHFRLRMDGEGRGDEVKEEEMKSF
jgi:hypothetical protein